MSQWHAFARLQSDAEKSEARGHPRFVTNSFACEKGIVADFSATGLRIVYRKCQKFEAGDVVDLELYSQKGEFQCPATVMWVTRKSRKQFEVGFEFVDPEMAKKMRLFDLGYDSLRKSIFDR